MKLVVRNVSAKPKRVRIIKLAGDGRTVIPKYTKGTDVHDGSIDIHLNVDKNMIL